MKSVAFFVFCFTVYGWAQDASCPPAFAQRPAEIVRAGRMSDDTPSLISFADVANWRMEVSNAVARIEYASDRVIFGDGACKITYRSMGGSARPYVRMFLPQPVALPADCDTLSIWVWGNNSYGRPKGTPPTTVHGIFENARGERTVYQLAYVHHPRWSKFYVKISPWLAGKIAPEPKLAGFMLCDGRNDDDRFIYLDAFSAFKEELKPLTFAPRAKRGVRLFEGCPQGINIAEGKLPFPNTPRTVLPPAKKPNPALEYRIPQNPMDWSSLAFRWQGGDWVPLAHGGGIFPAVAAKDAKIEFHRDGDSLVCDVVRQTPGIEEIRFGAVAYSDAEAIPIPFWSYNEKGWTNRPCVVTVRLPNVTVFVSATPDWTQSNASELFAGRSAPGLAAANGGVRYKKKTDGKRNGCFERLIWTVSENFTSTLPTIPNPPSPWKDVTGTHAWHALWGHKVATCRDFWHGLKRRGMKKIFASDYGTFWSDHRDSVIPYGEGTGSMQTFAAVDKGGDEGFRDYVAYVTGKIGFRYGPYNDYTDIYPIQAEWSPDNVSRNPNGSLQTAWTGGYSPKPVWAVSACERIAPVAQAKFKFNGGYCDVHTCTAPWSRTDYDARVPGAGTFAQTFYAYGELLLLQRKIWGGPVYSEGGMHWMYAGLADGNYGQDQSYDLPRNPWLVDFNLKRIHPLSCDFGMGHNLNMFYVHGVPEGVGQEQAIDRFLAATAAFGHSPYLIINWTNSARSYFLLQSLASRYTRADGVEIRYADAAGALHSVSEAVAKGTHRRSQIVVQYSDGTVIAANGAMNETLCVSAGGKRITLPPNGFWGLSGDGEAESFLGEIDGHRAEWARGDGYLYYNGRGTFTHFPDGTAVDEIVVRLKESDITEEVIPTKAHRIELPFVAKEVRKLDYFGKDRGPSEFTAREGCTVLEEPLFSWRITRAN